MFKDRTLVPILNRDAHFMSSLSRSERELENINIALIVHMRTKLSRAERFTCKRFRFRDG
jgi:hypothetical protein